MLCAFMVLRLLVYMKIVFFFFSVSRCRMVHFMSPSVSGHRDDYHLCLCEKQQSRHSRFESTVVQIVYRTVRFDLYHSIVRYSQGARVVSNIL